MLITLGFNSHSLLLRLVHHSSQTKLIPGVSPLGSYMTFWAPHSFGKTPVTPAPFSSPPNGPSLSLLLHHYHGPTLHAADFHLHQLKSPVACLSVTVSVADPCLLWPLLLSSVYSSWPLLSSLSCMWTILSLAS